MRLARRGRNLLLLSVIPLALCVGEGNRPLFGRARPDCRRQGSAVAFYVRVVILRVFCEGSALVAAFQVGILPARPINSFAFATFPSASSTHACCYICRRPIRVRQFLPA